MGLVLAVGRLVLSLSQPAWKFGRKTEVGAGWESVYVGEVIVVVVDVQTGVRVCPWAGGSVWGQAVLVLASGLLVRSLSQPAWNFGRKMELGAGWESIRVGRVVVGITEWG